MISAYTAFLCDLWFRSTDTAQKDVPKSDRCSVCIRYNEHIPYLYINIQYIYIYIYIYIYVKAQIGSERKAERGQFSWKHTETGKMLESFLAVISQLLHILKLHIHTGPDKFTRPDAVFIISVL